MGYPEEFSGTPLLESVGWRERIPLEEVVFFERYGKRAMEEKSQNG